MLKWLGLRPQSPPVRTVQRTEEEWRRSDQLSLFLHVQHHLTSGTADWQSSLSVSTYNSLVSAGFAEGWTLPPSGGPRRHPLLDGQTISEFVTLERNNDSRPLSQVIVREAHAWDWLYRSQIAATGISFCLSLPDEAMDRLIEKVRIGEYVWSGGSTLYSFAVRLPVRREFAFPEPRASEKPYSEGPDTKPLRDVAKLGADWIEVAALDSKRFHNEPVKELPLGELFADAGPIRISFDGK